MVEIDNLVLGKGFMGVAVYKALEGDKMLVYEDVPEGASKSAAGIISEYWYVASTIRSQYHYPFNLKFVKEGVAWLNFNGAKLTPVPELKKNILTNNQKWIDGTWLLWNKDEYLNSVTGNKEKITAIDTINNIVTTDKNTYRANKLYICLGVGVLEFIDMPIKPLKGEAMFVKDEDSTLITEYVAPYTHFTSRPWSKGIKRIGDTTRKSHMGYLQSRFGEKLMEITTGFRPYPTEKAYVFHKVDNSFVFTSGGRVGLGLSGMVGNNLKKLINGEIRF